MLSAPSAAQLTRLYDAADAFHRLAPWEWMEETNLFSLSLPGREEPGFVSVMGMAGNHTALALYLGREALERFNLLHSPQPPGQDDSLRLILESRQLQASFNGRADLEKAELAEIKALGRKYRGDNWPCFRTYHPGQAPGPVTAQEAEWLQIALEQASQVAPRLRSSDSGTFRMSGGGMEMLHRHGASGGGPWQDQWLPFHGKDYEFPRPPCQSFLAAAVARHSHTADLECLFQLVPSSIGPRFGERHYAYILLISDAASQMVLGFEFLSTQEQPFDELIASVPDLFLKHCDKVQLRPRQLNLSSQATAALLSGPSLAVPFSIKMKSSLPALDRLLASMPI